MSVQSYRDLEVWQRAMALAQEVYRLPATLPAEERYAMASQMRRVATSIPANIAEGWGRHYPAEFIQFLRRANGRRTELETHLLLCGQVGLAPEDGVEPLLKDLEILGKQLLALERSIRARNRT